EVKLVDPSDFGAVSDVLRADPIVRNVINVENFVKNVLTFTDTLRTAGTVVLLIVGVIVLFIIANTISLAAVARAAEIETPPRDRVDDAWCSLGDHRHLPPAHVHLRPSRTRSLAPWSRPNPKHPHSPTPPFLTASPSRRSPYPSS